MLGAVYGLSTLVGPLVGALLLEKLSWHWAFFINIPGALVALARFRALEHEQAQPSEHRLDYLGTALLAVGLVAALLSTRENAVSVADGGPIVSPWLLAGIAVAALLLWWRVERRAADPLVPLGLFSRPTFVVISCMAAFSGVLLFSAVVFVPLALQRGFDMSPTYSAFATFPLMAGVIIGSQTAGQAMRARRPSSGGWG